MWRFFRAVFVVVCAMCHSRRYALGRGTGAALVNRYCATHHDCHPQAGMKKNTHGTPLWIAFSVCCPALGFLFVREGLKREKDLSKGVVIPSLAKRAFVVAQFIAPLIPFLVYIFPLENFQFLLNFFQFYKS